MCFLDYVLDELILKSIILNKSKYYHIEINLARAPFPPPDLIGLFIFDKTTDFHTALFSENELFSPFLL